MPLIEEKFDQGRIDTLKRFLQRETDKNHPRDYEILVDGFKVVSRTSNLDEFEDYEQEIRDNTRSVSIIIYDGPGTNRNTRHNFLLHAEPTGQRSLNGLGEIDQVVAQRMEEREREYELQRVKEKLSTTEQKLDEAEEYADQLERKIKEMEDKRYTTAISMGELASAVLKGIVRQNIERIPGGQALAGLLGAELPEQPTHSIPAPPEPVAASFEKAAPTDLTQEVKDRLSLIEQMQQRFNEQEMISVFSILDSLTATPDRIPAVIEFLGIQTVQPQAA